MKKGKMAPENMESKKMQQAEKKMGYPVYTPPSEKKKGGKK
jgi:hypothetical protein